MRAVGYFAPSPITAPDSLVDIEPPRPSATGRDLLVEVRAVSRWSARLVFACPTCDGWLVTNLVTICSAEQGAGCSALILCGAFARFASWFPIEAAFGKFLDYVSQAWGSGVAAPFFIPSRANDPAFQRWFGRLERLGATPVSVTAYMRMNSQIDISGVLPTIQVPTRVIHRTEDVTINIEGGRYLAEQIPGARLLEFPGSDHAPMWG
jgi:pimeloyl-ACP methyl ester carboxylesterase